ncbi:MAG: metallophosphoesterase family protein, partial [Flavitalea sp.]
MTLRITFPFTFVIILLLIQGSLYSQTTLIPYGATWKYLDNGTDPGTTWATAAFNDASWSSGASELGYGDGDETTVVSFGGNTNSKYITTYFRSTVSIPSPSAYATFSFNIKRDDGFVLYVNGVEAGRNNMPTGTITTSTPASTAIEDAIINVPVATTFFVAGTNTIAVEIHQANITSSDISFNLQLQGTDAFTANVTRGPYLQMGNQTSLTVRWRTGSTMDAKVEVGTTFGTYPLSFTSGSTPADHSVNVTGLSADTKYYYRIGNTTTMGSADPDNFFTTLPPANTTRKINIAAFGDCGRNDNSFQSQTLAQYRSYLSANSIDAPDAWLLLGDNAYNAGTDAEYTSNFFTAYGSTILKNHKVFPTPGNHDYANTVSRQQDHAIPYYDIFTMPTAGEIGGVASGTEAYYSFNIGNIHFLALDAYGNENGGTTRLYDTTGAQVTWIKADLAANSKKWTICFWHHPPYTKGSHDSDTDPELIKIRENFIRILERNGVDMVVCGHSHDYERSYL